MYSVTNMSGQWNQTRPGLQIGIPVWIGSRFPGLILRGLPGKSGSSAWWQWEAKSGENTNLEKANLWQQYSSIKSFLVSRREGNLHARDSYRALPSWILSLQLWTDFSRFPGLIVKSFSRFRFCSRFDREFPVESPGNLPGLIPMTRMLDLIE